MRLGLTFGLTGQSNAPGSGYAATAVTFSSDYLTRGADFTGAADSKLGLCSFWIKFNGGDASLQRIMSSQGGVQEIVRGANDVISFSYRNAASSVILDLRALGSVTTASGWTHVLAAWDLANTFAEVYIDDAVASNKITVTNDTIDYTRPNWVVGASVGGTTLLDADIADFYWAAGQFLDITVESNRRKFIDANGKPVDLGDDGSTPTSTAPIVFLKSDGDTTSFIANSGTGGGMTENGTLAVASTSPSD